MASPETIGTCTCENCGAVTYVKKNKGGFPYSRCGNCDHETREHSQKGARIFLQKVTIFEAEREPEKMPEKAEKTETPPAKTAQKKPAPGSVASFLLGG